MATADCKPWQELIALPVANLQSYHLTIEAIIMTSSTQLSVYCITNKQNGKQYIGITKLGMHARFKKHVQDAKSRKYNAALGAAIRKYGEDQFTLTEIYRAASYKELEQMETHFIKRMRTFAPHGYNLTWGGDYNWKLVCPERAKARAEAAGKALRGIKRPIEFGRKISNAKKGRPLTQQNLDSIRRVKSRPMRCIETGMVFNNGHLVEKWLREQGHKKAGRSGVVSCCQGKSKTSYGYTWEYVDGTTPEFKPKPIGRNIKCIETGEVFDTVTKASQFVIETTNPKAATSPISKAANGKLRHAYGFRWEYV